MDILGDIGYCRGWEVGGEGGSKEFAKVGRGEREINVELLSLAIDKDPVI